MCTRRSTRSVAERWRSLGRVASRRAPSLSFLPRYPDHADKVVLSKVMRCDFEELDEKRKVINYERVLRKAQAAIDDEAG